MFSSYTLFTLLLRPFVNGYCIGVSGGTFQYSMLLALLGILKTLMKYQLSLVFRYNLNSFHTYSRNYPTNL